MVELDIGKREESEKDIPQPSSEVEFNGLESFEEERKVGGKKVLPRGDLEVEAVIDCAILFY